MVAVEPRGAGHRRDVGAGFLLRQREGGEPFARARLRQHGGAQLGRARDGDGAGAEALHREGEIGEAVAPRERLAREARRARVDAGRVAVRRRDGGFKKSRLPHCADEAPT